MGETHVHLTTGGAGIAVKDMKLERRFDGEVWAWCIITGKGEVLAEFASQDDAAVWMRQHVRATHDKARTIERERMRQ